MVILILTRKFIVQTLYRQEIARTIDNMYCSHEYPHLSMDFWENYIYTYHNLPNCDIEYGTKSQVIDAI